MTNKTFQEIPLILKLLFLATIVMVGCPLGLLFIRLLVILPRPSPMPYPGAIIGEKDHKNSGSHFAATHQTFTATVPIDKVEQYYKQELNYYCVDEWQFENDEEDKTCRRVHCYIYRHIGQEFYLEICPISETSTLIIHDDGWYD
jgi:hypothetical protein